MGERKVVAHQFLNAEAADGAGVALKVDDFDEIIVFIGAPSSTLICKALGAITETEPADWTLAPSVAAQHDGQLMIWNSDGTTTIKGNTGVVLAAATYARMLRINVRLLKWLNFVVSGFVGGSVTVNMLAVRYNR